MKYPKKEPLKSTSADRLSDRQADAKIYMNSESWSESVYKCKALRLYHMRLFFNDAFRMHYFYSNGLEWIYKAEWTHCASGLIGGVYAAACILVAVVNKLPPWLLFPAFSTAPATVVKTTKDAAKQASAALNLSGSKCSEI